MARRKSSRGRVFYYPSSLPKMRDGGDTNQQNDEYTTTLDLISTYKGYNPSAMKEALNKIAWHETGMTLNPKQLQGNDPKKPGKGLYQFEKDSLATAIQSAKNFYKSAGEPVPDWINNLNTTDATTLSASQQSSLAALNMVQRKNFPVRQALENEKGLVEAWSKGWQTKNDPAKKALFKEHLEIYKDKGIKTELPTVTFLDPIRSLPKFQNGSRIGNGTEDTDTVPIRVDVATGLPKLKKGGDIQRQGYKDNSRYKNRPFIDIHSNNITMDGVSQRLLARTDTGQERILEPNSGNHYFPGANVVREIPLEDIPSYFLPSTKGLNKYQNGGGILTEPISEDVPTTLTPEVTITGFKDKSPSFTGLPTIAPEYSKSWKKCSAKGCAEQATTEFANIVGTSREDIYPLVGTDAWYRKSKVLSNPNNELIFEAETADYDGYKNLPVKPEDDWWKNIDFQVGDFVDLSGKIVGGWRSSKQPKIGKASKDGYSQSDFSRHSGIIIGKTPEGIPIVRHNINGILHDEPINDITESYNYFVSAAYRVNDENLNIGKQKYSIKQQEKYENILDYSDESLNLGFTGSVVDDKGNILKVNTKKVKNKLVEPYKEIRKDLVVKYGVSQERLDDVFKSLLAIGTQESNLDNMVDDSFKSKAKVEVLDFLTNSDIKIAKHTSNVKGLVENLLSDYEVAEVPTWKLDKEIALLETQGVSREEAKHQIFSQYGAPSKTDKVTDKSKGPFRQKAPSGRWLNTMGKEYSTVEAMKKANWGKEWDDSNKNFIANAIGLYLDNYDKAKELYGENESEEFLNQVATLAHNAPSKAFTKEYTDFYVKGIDNPDLEKYNAGYVNKVYKAKESMFRQPKSPRVDNKGTYQGFIDKSAESSTQQQNANTPLVDIPSYFSGGKVNLTKYQNGGQLPKEFKYDGGTDGDVETASKSGKNVVTDFIDNNAGNLLTEKGAIHVINNPEEYPPQKFAEAVSYVGNLYPNADSIITEPGKYSNSNKYGVPEFKNGGQLPKAQEGRKISKGETRRTAPTYITPEMTVQAFPNATPAQRAALSTGPGNPIYRNAKSQLINNKKPGTFANETADAFNYLAVEGPMEILQTPQSLLVEGIEAARGNDYNFKNAFPQFVTDATNKQRLPSQTFLQNAPFPLQVAGDIFIDPFAVVGAAKGGINAVRYVKNFPKAFALNLDNVGAQAFKPILKPKQLPTSYAASSVNDVGSIINRYKSLPKASEFLGRREFIKNLQKKGLIGQDFTTADLNYAARSLEKTNKLTELALDRYYTGFRSTSGKIPSGGIGRQSYTNKPFNMSKPAYGQSISEFENMSKAGVDFTDPRSIAEYQATHIPLEDYGYRATGEFPTSEYGFLFRSPSPTMSKEYGKFQFKGKPSLDYNSGNYSDWFKKYYSDLNYHHAGDTYGGSTKDKLASIEKVLWRRSFDPRKPKYGKGISDVTFVGPRGTKAYDIDPDFMFTNFDDILSNPTLEKNYKEYIKKFNDQYRTGWRGEYRNGGALPKAEIMIDPATGLPKLKKGGKAWIQGAIKKPGALKATAKRAGATESDGTIKKTWLREKARGSGKTAQRARLAITLGKMKK